MGRRWNQLRSAVYTRVPWLSETYVRVAGKRWEHSIPLPPLAPLVRPLPQATVALLTSAGVHLHSQQPFDMTNQEGDATFRIIPGDTPAADLTVTHDYYDHKEADRDVNCVFPIERLREMVATGSIGRVAPRHVGFMGHVLGRERARLVERTAGEIAAVFRSDGVDAVLASPG